MPGWFHSAGPSDSTAGDGNGDSPAESAHQFREGLGNHLKARAELLALEAGEAGEIVAQKGILGLLTTAFFLFAHALVLCAVISLLGRWTSHATGELFGWELPALLIGIIHLFVALALLRKLKKKPEQALFEYTRAEFRKDHAWLDQDKNSRKEKESSP